MNCSFFSFFYLILDKISNIEKKKKNYEQTILIKKNLSIYTHVKLRG